MTRSQASKYEVSPQPAEKGMLTVNPRPSPVPTSWAGPVPGKIPYSWVEMYRTEATPAKMDPPPRLRRC